MKFWKTAVMRNAGKNVVSANRGMTRLFYNAMGRFYDLLYHRLIRGYVESAETLMNDLVREGDWVLDIGCGTGLLCFLAAPKQGEWWESTWPVECSRRRVTSANRINPCSL